jgi:hypothetical protein
VSKLLIVVCVGGLLLGLTWVAVASPAALSLGWWTVDGGGHTASQGGGYELGGTAGQPDAGVLSSGEFTLGGGFWRGGAVAEVAYGIYLPLILR